MSQQECVEERSALDETQPDELTVHERERLSCLRRAMQRGERSDRYPVDKRQDFVRWLISQGKLSEN
ncbi:MAG: hypothetical protein ACR2NO_06825 [Chloroflexota bacterium]